MDREAWRAAVHGVAKSRMWLSEWTEPIAYKCSLFSSNKEDIPQNVTSAASISKHTTTKSKQKKPTPVF